MPLPLIPIALGAGALLLVRRMSVGSLPKSGQGTPAPGIGEGQIVSPHTTRPAPAPPSSTLYQGAGVGATKAGVGTGLIGSNPANYIPERSLQGAGSIGGGLLTAIRENPIPTIPTGPTFATAGFVPTTQALSPIRSAAPPPPAPTQIVAPVRTTAPPPLPSPSPTLAGSGSIRVSPTLAAMIDRKTS